MKEYVKPELYYESFELSQHIAGCYLKLESADINNCISVLEGVGTLFVQNRTACDVPVANPDMYCYTNGSGAYNTFQS